MKWVKVVFRGKKWKWKWNNERVWKYFAVPFVNKEAVKSSVKHCIRDSKNLKKEKKMGENQNGD